jgi:hypothetical protein
MHPLGARPEPIEQFVSGRLDGAPPPGSALDRGQQIWTTYTTRVAGCRGYRSGPDLDAKDVSGAVCGEPDGGVGLTRWWRLPVMKLTTVATMTRPASSSYLARNRIYGQPVSKKVHPSRVVRQSPARLTSQLPRWSSVIAEPSRPLFDGDQTRVGTACCSMIALRELAPTISTKAK